MKKRKITDNIPLKIMSVAIAVVLWLIVVNIDNPTGTNYYTLRMKRRTTSIPFRSVYA